MFRNFRLAESSTVEVCAGEVTEVVEDGGDRRWALFQGNLARDLSEKLHVLRRPVAEALYGPERDRGTQRERKVQVTRKDIRKVVRSEPYPKVASTLPLLCLAFSWPPFSLSGATWPRSDANGGSGTSSGSEGKTPSRRCPSSWQRSQGRSTSCRPCQTPNASSLSGRRRRPGVRGEAQPPGGRLVRDQRGAGDQRRRGRDRQGKVQRRDGQSVAVFGPRHGQGVRTRQSPRFTKR